MIPRGISVKKLNNFLEDLRNRVYGLKDTPIALE